MLDALFFEPPKRRERQDFKFKLSFLVNKIVLSLQVHDIDEQLHFRGEIAKGKRPSHELDILM